MFADWQMQQKALKDAERRKKKEAAESLNQFRGVDKQQELLLEARKAKQEDRQKQKGAADNLHNFKGATQELDFQKQLKEKKEKEKKGKKAAKDILSTYSFSPTPAKSKSQKLVPTEGLQMESLDIEGQQRRSQILPRPGLERRTSSYGEFQDIKKEKKKKEKKSKKEKTKSKPGKLKEWKPQSSPSATSKKKEIDVGKSRKTVTLGFSLGVITDEDDIPSVEMIDEAAAAIVPEILKGALKECNVRCDCKTPTADGDIEEDAWFESEDSIRWKVSGTVPVKLFVDKGKDIEEIAAPIQKMLKRYTSWRLVTEGGKSEWKRVREGRLALGITF